jgi:hypothetical protein
MSLVRSKLIVCGWIFGVLSIVFLVQVIFSIIVVSNEGTYLEEKGIVTYYSFACWVLFLLDPSIAFDILITMWRRGYTIFWLVPWVVAFTLSILCIVFILESGYNYITVSLCIFGITFSDLILVIHNLKLSRDNTVEEELVEITHTLLSNEKK